MKNVSSLVGSKIFITYSKHITFTHYECNWIITTEFYFDISFPYTDTSYVDRYICPYQYIMSYGKCQYVMIIEEHLNTNCKVQ